MTNMVLLVGEQPAPNLLPLKHYNPSNVILVHTSRTARIASRLAQVIGNIVKQPFCDVEPYRVDPIKEELQSYIGKLGWTGNDLVFNLTGGTKPMATAAFEIARQMEATAFYYQTEDNQSLIHPYRYDRGSLVTDIPVSIAETLTLDSYLRLYVGDYEPDSLPKDPFEDMVYRALHENQWPGLEMMPAVYLKGVGPNVEVDMLARVGNQVAAFEVKRSASKKAIDQLNGVTDQRTLGTYTRKILVSANPLEVNNLELAKAHRMRVVVLESGVNDRLSPGDIDKLIDAVKDTLILDRKSAI